MNSKTFIRATVAFCALCLAAGIAHAQPTQKQMARLQSGYVITQTAKDETSGDRVSTGYVIFRAPQEMVWKVLTNYAEYPEFLPDITTLKVEKKDAAKLRVQINFRNLLPFPDFKVRAVIDENHSAGIVSLKMEDGDFEKYYTSWKLTSLDQDQVLAEYRLYKYVGWWWFPMVPNYLGNESQVGEYLNAFKKQVQMAQVQDSSNSSQLIKPIWRKSSFKDKKKPKPGEPDKEAKPDEKGKLPNLQPEIHRPEYRH